MAFEGNLNETQLGSRLRVPDQHFDLDLCARLGCGRHSVSTLQYFGHNFLIKSWIEVKFMAFES